jgi:hypothetical protein
MISGLLVNSTEWTTNSELVSTCAKTTTPKKKELSNGIDELEEDLGEVALLLRTMPNLCMQKGLICAEEMMAKPEELEALDHVIDGRIGKPADQTKLSLPYS